MIPKTATAPARLLVCLAALCLALALATLTACGNRQDPGATEGPPTVGEDEPAVPDTVWVAQEMRDPSELLDVMQEGFEACQEAKAFSPTDPAAVEAMVAAGEIASLFAQGNRYYRNGSYKEALGAYDEVLASLPKHLGTNNNRTLALLQLGQSEKALVQASKTLYLYPEEYGCVLNFQIAAKAEGFSAAAVLEGMSSLYEEYEDISSPFETRFNDHEALVDASNYNSVAQNIEFLLSKNADDLHTTVNNLKGQLYTTELYTANDPDTLALIKYLEGVEALLATQ
ncbi:MAG: hypothetical protein LBS58_04030 [Coriobacteriales bacterium]|jgi:tetratricopeptide (TPR) repeat protein|nr:hypothetical protein [Coriobacteriales bacterium]